MDKFALNMEYIGLRGFDVDAAGFSEQPGIEVELGRARDGNLTFAVIREGRKTSFHSAYRPLEEAARLVAGLEQSNNPDLIMVFGMGIGYVLPLLRARFGSHPHIVVVEPDPAIFGHILKHIDLREIFDDKTWLVCTGDMGRPVRQLNALLNTAMTDRILFMEHPVYVREYGSYLERLTEEIKKFINNRLINLATTIHFNERWLLNSLANLPYFCRHPGINRLKDMFRDIPAVVVAAGPSLDKNIHLLEKMKNRAVIICVGTAVKALLKHDIKPDLIVTIDAGEPNYMHFKDIDVSDIPLIFNPIVYPEILRHHHGKKFVVNIGTKVMNWLEQFTGEKGLVSTGGSVANVAFGVAVILGANPIVLVGQDLAYTGDKTHASGSAWEGRVVNRFEGNPIYLQVPGYDGGMVWTSRTLYNFLVWFEEAVILHPDKTIINATEGGACIKGTVQIPLREVIDRYCRTERDIKAEIDAGWENFCPEGIGRLQSALVDIGKRLQKLKSVCDEGIKTGTKILRQLSISGGSANSVNGLLKRLDRVDKQIKEERELTAFMDEALQAVILSVLHRSRNLAESGKKDLAGLVGLSLELYENIGNSCKRFGDYFFQAAKNIGEEEPA